jgi:hypothetical protein
VAGAASTISIAADTSTPNTILFILFLPLYSVCSIILDIYHKAGSPTAALIAPHISADALTTAPRILERILDGKSRCTSDFLSSGLKR